MRKKIKLSVGPGIEVEEVRYSIIKNIDSKSRIAIQRNMASGAHLSPMQALYFGGTSFEPFAMMHAGQRDHDNG